MDYHNSITKLKIGTDCSGIEAPIQALIKLKIRHVHLFSSEIDKFARESILANYSPKVLYEDMRQPRLLPKLDLYVCGFPCQPFSTAGKRQGEKDPRGNIFMSCINTIKQTNPSIFILENVKGLTTMPYFDKIIMKLDELNEYSVEYTILNTKDYGIPQNRERLYIVGIRKSKMKRPFKVPKSIVCKDIQTFIDRTRTEKENYCDSFKKVFPQFKDATFATIAQLRQECNGKYKVNPNISSTIIANHPLWCISMHRKATIKECLELQGFPTNFKQVVSDTQMRRQIGNSMSVNVLCYLIKECLGVIGW
jgi:DNA (cytosine-5)-methyltransferase 1